MIGLRYYDRDGEPITLEQWGGLVLDRDYPQIATHWVRDWAISTVWLGMNLAMTGPPHIFQTMVLAPDGDTRVERYSSEEEARAGHLQIVKHVIREARASIDEVGPPLAESSTEPEGSADG